MDRFWSHAACRRTNGLGSPSGWDRSAFAMVENSSQFKISWLDYVTVEQYSTIILNLYTIEKPLSASECQRKANNTPIEGSRVGVAVANQKVYF